MSGPPVDFDIIGGGPSGLLMALLLAQRGQRVAVYERRPDPRFTPAEAGRSINLALAARGLAALDAAGLRPAVADLLVPMRGRLLHDIGGAQTLVPYGQRPHEVIHSIPRSTLTLRLTEAAARMPGIALTFEARCNGLDGNGRPHVEDTHHHALPLRAPRCIGADGAGSALRHALEAAGQLTAQEDMLDHDYRELEIPAKAGEPAMDPGALHIWPRGGYMLIALPNADHSFTATLFLPRHGTPGFDTLADPATAERFFAREFHDALRLIPDFRRQWASHPQGRLGTVHSSPWNQGESMLLIGDAAHAIVPFHGQGMNCAFEDCVILDALLAEGHADAFARYAAQRPRDTDAIAAMALENYAEMRDTVRDPLFQLHKALQLELERRHPQRFVPRYAMVMFRADIPYGVAQARGRVQEAILSELTRTAGSLAEVDFDHAARLIEARLPPIGAG